MNAQTTMTVRKAIQYMQQNAGRERLVGGSIPEEAGLVVALKPGAAEHSGSNGNPANGAHGANGTNGTHAPGAGDPTALQGLLVIPNPESDYSLIMEQLYDGSRVGTAGDYIGRKTRIEILEWREENIEEDGSLSDDYVTALSDKILRHAITPDQPYTAGVSGSTGPTPASEQPTDELNGESPDTHSGAPHSGAPQTDTAQIGPAQTEEPRKEAHAQLDQAQAGDTREPAVGAVAAADQAKIEGQDDAEPHTEDPEQTDGEEEEQKVSQERQQTEQAEQQARALRSWIHAQTEQAEQAADEAPESEVAHQEGSQEYSQGVGQNTDPVAGESPSSEPVSQGVQETAEDSDPANTDPDPASYTAPVSAPYSPDSARRRETLDEEPASGGGVASNNGASGNPSNAHDDGAAGGRAPETRYSGEYGSHIRSGLQEYHPEEEATLDSRTHDWLAALSTGKTQTPEQRQYLIAKHNSKKMASRLTFRKKPVPPPQLASIPQPETGAIDHIAESDRGPGVVVPMISKGGTGKTTVSIETAFALAMMFGAHGNNTASRTGRVLLLDMNLTNPDLAHRIAVDGAGTPGLKDLINGDHLSRVVNRTALPNLDVLFLLGRRDNDKGILPDVLGDPYAMNSLITAFLTNPAYDAIVVDTANTLPGEEDNPASYAMTMWANMADARYLVLQPEIASFRNATLFATRLTEALGHQNSELVPLLNSLPGKKVYEEAPITSAMAQKRRATIESVEVLERDTSIHVVKPMGQHQSQHLTRPLIIPDYPEEVRGFAAEGRPISMFSQTFANAYSRIALDAVRRMVNNRTRDPNQYEDDN